MILKNLDRFNTFLAEMIALVVVFVYPFINVFLVKTNNLFPEAPKRYLLLLNHRIDGRTREIKIGGKLFYR